MSYILEALKKADQERGVGAVPNLATPQEARRPQSRTYRWLWVIVALLGVNAVLVAMLLRDGDEAAPVTAQAPLERQSPPTDDPRVPPIRPTSEATSGETPAPERTVLPENEPILPTGGLMVLPEPANLQSSGSSPPMDERTGGGMEAMTTGPDTPQLQSWYELPEALRSRLDLPRLDLHVYSEEPQNRFIMVNLKKYREGETLESGLVLEEVLPDGMVLSYQGERFLVEK